MNEHEARKVLYEAAMREGLMKFLWTFREKEQEKIIGGAAMPMPPMDDDQIKKELKRIIGFK